MTSPGQDEIQAALDATGYTFTDPVADQEFPRIEEPTAADLEVLFPEGWSDEPTERDRAAIVGAG